MPQPPPPFRRSLHLIWIAALVGVVAFDGALFVHDAGIAEFHDLSTEAQLFRYGIGPAFIATAAALTGVPVLFCLLRLGAIGFGLVTVAVGFWIAIPALFCQWVADSMGHSPTALTDLRSTAALAGLLGFVIAAVYWVIFLAPAIFRQDWRLLSCLVMMGLAATGVWLYLS